MSLMNSVASFKFNGATAEDLKTFHKAFTGNDMTEMARLLANYVEQAPKEWGDATDPNTYLEASYLKVAKPAVQAFVSALTGDEEVVKDSDIAFDVYAITGKDMADIWKVKTTDFEAQAKVLARYAVAIDSKSAHFPDKFDVKKPEHYLALPIRVFRGVWNKFVSEINSKN